MQILPAIDLRNGKCVRLRQGDYSQETIFSDSPVVIAQSFANAGAKRLHLVDLDGAKEGKPVNQKVVRDIVSAIDIPCQLGGGIRDEAAIQLLLNDIGLDRVIVGTAALKNPDWFKQMVQHYPTRIALGLDARDSYIATDGWLEVSKVLAIDLAKNYLDLELAAIIYTNIANDGMMQGIDADTINDMIALTKLGFPVIASGGVTSLEDVRHLAQISQEHPKLTGMIIGRAIYEEKISVSEAVAIATS